MDEHFKLLHDNIRLTKSQRDDVKTKISGVSRSLYSEFYDNDYNRKTRLVIGSHGKRTQVRYPIGDIDLIFKISKEDLDRYQAYDGNGPSALLQRARVQLRKTYRNTSIIRTWGKVVLVKFSDGYHDVEVIPCFENNDNTFTIPNTEGNDGKGSWDIFDPRAEVDIVSESHARTGITREFIKIAKRWKNNATLGVKSYQIEFFSVSFLDEYYSEEKTWSQLYEEFMQWLEKQSADYSNDDESKILTARKRASKARELELDNKFAEASDEWRKIFGKQFPIFDESLDTVKALEFQYPTDEEYIQDVLPMRIDDTYTASINAEYSEGKSNPHPFSQFFRNNGTNLRKRARFYFTVVSNVTGNVEFFWKVRNFHYEAQAAGQLRGEIRSSGSRRTLEENSLYTGTHYVECYVSLDGIIVAKARRFVPIGRESIDE